MLPVLGGVGERSGRVLAVTESVGGTRQSQPALGSTSIVKCLRFTSSLVEK